MDLRAVPNRGKSDRRYILSDAGSEILLKKRCGKSPETFQHVLEVCKIGYLKVWEFETLIV